MTPPALSLLLCGFLLCGLQETLCLRVRCVGNHCVTLLDERHDFAGAKKRCKDSGGELFTLSHKYLPKSLSNGLYWVNVGVTPPESLCTAIRGPIATHRPCAELLDGVLCQQTFTASEMCGAVQAGRGTQINYVTYEGSEVHDSETFPQGSTAATVNISTKYLETKHICMGKTWMAGPWSCEVLKGGCEHNCSSTCTCPAGKILQPNNITCTEGPCKNNPCTGKGEECQNTKTGYKCTCKEGFSLEDGECVDHSICTRCEHMDCQKIKGVYQCVCRNGYKVADHDPTKCEVICTGRDCPATCVHNDKEDQCFCPRGYIKDTNKGKTFCTDINECEQSIACQHTCENLFGSYRCLCNESFTLDSDGYSCSRVSHGSSSTPHPPYATLASFQPTAVPYYVKTGSVLGIAVFVTLCAVLLCFLVRNAAKRCGRFELNSFKRPDMDLFYVQQVKTETYKRLSFDKQCKIDSVTL